MEQETKNTKPENPQAFPCTNDLATKYNEHGQSYGAETGMTLRDYFAAKAMQGILSFTGTDWDGPYGYSPEKVSIRVYEIADAMLIERSKP